MLFTLPKPFRTLHGSRLKLKHSQYRGECAQHPTLSWILCFIYRHEQLCIRDYLAAALTHDCIFKLWNPKTKIFQIVLLIDEEAQGRWNSYICIICSLYLHVGIGLYLIIIQSSPRKVCSECRCRDLWIDGAVQSLLESAWIDFFCNGGLFCMINVFWLFMNDKIISQKPL